MTFYGQYGTFGVIFDANGIGIWDNQKQQVIKRCNWT